MKINDAYRRRRNAAGPRFQACGRMQDSAVEHCMTEGMEVQGLWTPNDLEQEFGLEGGHLFHGEFALDQFLSFRPHPSLAGYATEIGGLFLGGAGMHPAGGFTLAQGILAARSV